MTWRRVLWTAVGGLAGFVVGVALAYVLAFAILDAAGVTNFVEDEPLHGLPVFLTVVALVPSIGVIVGCVVGWRRARPESHGTGEGHRN